MPKIIDHEQRREEIIAVTWQIIVEGGIEAATMREIAKRAGFANGALKHYFSGKDAIIASAYERSLHRIRERKRQQIVGKRGIEALELSLRSTLPMNPEDITAARVLLSFWERCVFGTDIDHDYSEHLRDWKASISRYLREGREDGDILTPLPDKQLVHEAILVNIGATVVRVVSPTQLSDQVLEAQVTAFIARLRCADAPECLDN